MYKYTSHYQILNEFYIQENALELSRQTIPVVSFPPPVDRPMRTLARGTAIKRASRYCDDQNEAPVPKQPRPDGS